MSEPALDAQALIDCAIDESTESPRQKRVWALAAAGIGLDGYDLFIMSVALPLVVMQFDAGSVAKGLVAAAAVLGAIPGALLSGLAADRWGRQRILRLDLVLFLVTAILSAVSWDLTSLFVFRFIQGFAVGAEYPISASLVAEIMPRARRGKWITGAFAFQAIGMLLAAGCSTAILLLDSSPNAWRWMLLSAAVPAVIVATLRISLRESPRWLARHGQLAQARESLTWLLNVPTPTLVRVGSDMDIEWELRYRTDRQVVNGSQHMAEAAADAAVDAASDALNASWRDLFGPNMRRRTAFTTVPWLIMDITLFGIGLFTPTLIGSLLGSASSKTVVGLDLESAAGTALADLFLVVGFLLNIVTVERLGRAKLQVLGFLGMGIGIGLVAHAGMDAGMLAILPGFAMFNLMVNWGPNATTYMLPAEVFPTSVRATGHGLAAAVGKVGAAIGTFLLPIAVAGFGLERTLITIAGLCVLGAFVTWLYRVETRGMALR